VFICTTTRSSVAREGISGEERRRRGERSSNTSKAPTGQDTGSVERCVAGEGRGTRIALPDKGGGLDPRHRIRDVHSIRATEEGEVRRQRGKGSSNCAVGEGEVRHQRGEGTSNHTAGEGVELEPCYWIWEVGSIHAAGEVM
jgi:hypothetical protein